MKITETKLQGVKIIEPDVFYDQRGFFLESFNKKRYIDAGIATEFVQDNISKSVINTIRGLHYQTGEYAQGKLCQVIKGSVLDVAVDIRFNSPTFGQYVAVELNDREKKQLWIPPGFAHGFSVLSDEVIFHYKCTNYYNKQSERAILYNDSTIGVDWRVKEPVVSEKDMAAKAFVKIEKDFYFKEEQ